MQIRARILVEAEAGIELACSFCPDGTHACGRFHPHAFLERRSGPKTRSNRRLSIWGLSSQTHTRGKSSRIEAVNRAMTIVAAFVRPLIGHYVIELEDTIDSGLTYAPLTRRRRARIPRLCGPLPGRAQNPRRAADRYDNDDAILPQPGSLGRWTCRSARAAQGDEQTPGRLRAGVRSGCGEPLPLLASLPVGRTRMSVRRCATETTMRTTASCSPGRAGGGGARGGCGVEYV